MKADYFRYMEIEKSEVSPMSGNWIMGVRWMSEVTRGRVDNENNNQSRYLNILNIVQGGVYIYKSESIAIRNRNILEYRLEHRKAVCTGRETQECYVRTWDRNRNQIRTGTGTGTKLEMVIWGRYWWYPSSSVELNSGNLGSQCEAVIAVLQGLMSSKVKLVPGVWQEVWQVLELAEVLFSKVTWVLWDVTWLFPCNPVGPVPHELLWQCRICLKLQK